MKRTKTQKGITLVALIITIVVLLVLALVSINSIQNDGIMGQAQSAADKFNMEKANEGSTLNGYEQNFNKYSGNSESNDDSENGGGSENNYVAYSRGDSVTVAGEEFWVIQNSGTSEANVVLLAKKSIDTNNLVQSSTANQIAFSESMYWSADGKITETSVPPNSSHYAAYAAYQYGAKLEGNGRLLTADEAVSLIKYDSNNTMIVSDLLTNGTWLGFARNNEGLVMVVLGDGYFRELTQQYNTLFYVRPVVEISKDKIV